MACIVDLIGPIKSASCGGKRYIFTIIDDYSRVIFVELLKEKSDAADRLKGLIALKENQSGRKLKSLRSDNGGEFIGIDIQEWLEEKGIRHELSPPRTPQCNGVVERANRSIIEMTRSMMLDSRMPLDFWAEAVCAAVHIKNRIKSMVHGRTPYEMWHCKKPNIKYLRRFGCTAYLLDKEGGRKKFDAKTIKGIFVGYGANKIYRVYVPDTERIKMDCDVKFDEDRNGCEMLIRKGNEDTSKNESLIIMGLNSADMMDERQQEEIEIGDQDRRTESESSEYEDAEMEKREHGVGIRDENQEHHEDEDIDEIQSVEVRKIGRPKGSTKAIMEARRNLLREEKRQEHGDLRRSERIKDQQKALLVIDNEIPKNIGEAKNLDDWRFWEQAIKDELGSMKKHKVWDIVSRPKDKRIIKSKWIFNIKEDPSTGQRHYKARLVALGCEQRSGVDYQETFAPVVRTETR